MRSDIKKIVLVAILAISSASSYAQKKENPIVLRTMGSLFFGGSVLTTESGETFHEDHGYAQYYIPEKSRSYPIVMWHGIGQSGRTYESTPDEREGYMSILPRRFRAGYTMSKINTTNAIPTILKESAVWDAFRNGIRKRPATPYFFTKTQFPKSAYPVDQFFRQQAPDTGEEPRTDKQRAFMGKTMAKLLEETGPAILITHSNSGQYGWATAMEASEKLKAIVAYEPGRAVFPNNEIPDSIANSVDFVNDALAPQLVPIDEFKKLTKMPFLSFTAIT